MPRAKPKAGVAWEEPPTAVRPVWREVADELRAHPMEWMKVYANGRSSWAEAVRKGHVAVLNPNLGFEFSTTDNTRDTPRHCTLYARHNPSLVDPVAEAIRKGRNS